MNWNLRNSSCLAVCLTLVACGDNVSGHIPASKSAPNPSQLAAPPKPDRMAVAAQGVQDSWLSLTKATEPCDKGSTGVEAALGRFSKGKITTVGLFSATAKATTACREAAIEVANIRPSREIDKALRRKIDEALAPCREAYSTKAKAMDNLNTAVDANNLSPSTVSMIQMMEGMAGSQALQCATLFDAAARSVNVELEKPNVK
jgi:hypothetical protein